MTRADDTLDARFPRVRRWIMPVRTAGAALIVFAEAMAYLWPQAVARSYLFAYVFWVNVSLGCLGWLMLGHITGGAWGRTTRRVCESAATNALTFLAVSGLILLFKAGHLYGWADPAVWSLDPVLSHRRPWFSMPWVATRAVTAGVGWVVLAAWLRRLSFGAGCRR